MLCEWRRPLTNNTKQNYCILEFEAYKRARGSWFLNSTDTVYDILGQAQILWLYCHAFFLVFFPSSSCLLPDLFLSSSRLLPVFFLSSSRILSVLFPSYSLLPRRWSPSGRVDTTLGLKHVVRVESGGEELVLQRLVDTWFCQLWCTQHYTALETSPAILVLYLSNSTWRIIIY